MWEKNGLNSHKLSQNFNFLPLSDAPADCFNIVSIFHHSNKESHITPLHGFILYGFQVAEFPKHRKLAFCFLLPPNPPFLSFPPIFSSFVQSFSWEHLASGYIWRICGSCVEVSCSTCVCLCVCEGGDGSRKLQPPWHLHSLDEVSPICPGWGLIRKFIYQSIASVHQKGQNSILYLFCLLYLSESVWWNMQL